MNGVEVAVEHALDVAGLVLGAQVLHHLVRLQHVGADLAAEADRAAARRAIASSSASRFCALEVGQLGLEHLHGPVLVLVLAALVLARHDDAGRAGG